MSPEGHLLQVSYSDFPLIIFRFAPAALWPFGKILCGLFSPVCCHHHTACRPSPLVSINTPLLPTSPPFSSLLFKNLIPIDLVTYIHINTTTPPTHTHTHTHSSSLLLLSMVLNCLQLLIPPPCSIILCLLSSPTCTFPFTFSPPLARKPDRLRIVHRVCLNHGAGGGWGGSS